MDKPARPRRGLLIALGVTALGVGLAYFIERWGAGWVARYRSTLIAAVWLYLPLPVILRNKDPSEHYGIGWGIGIRGLVETLAVSAAVLVPFYAVFFAIYPIKWGIHTLPDKLWIVALVQLLVIAVPEEFFFRGYLQTELEKISKRKWKLPGAELGYGWIAASALFALGHLAIQATPMRAAVFFPALLFGWVRARTNSVAYSAVMHALFNFTFLIAQKMSGI